MKQAGRSRFLQREPEAGVSACTANLLLALLVRRGGMPAMGRETAQAVCLPGRLLQARSYRQEVCCSAGARLSGLIQPVGGQELVREYNSPGAYQQTIRSGLLDPPFPAHTCLSLRSFLLILCMKQLSFDHVFQTCGLSLSADNGPQRLAKSCHLFVGQLIKENPADIGNMPGGDRA